MKKSFIIISIGVLLMLANVVMSGNKIDFDQEGAGLIISPFSEKSEFLTKLYFVENQQLVSETRNIDVEVFQTEVAVLNALKKGPKISTAASPLKEGVEILSVEIIDRVGYVNLSSDFRDEEYKMYLNVMAVVNTLTEFNNIDRVQVLIEGNKVGAKNSIMDFPMLRDSSIVHEIELLHKDIVNRFLNYIGRGRYDLAYDLIDSKSKTYMSYNDFVNNATVIREDIRGYTQSYIFAEENAEGFLIQVKYKLQDVSNYDQTFINDRKPIDRVFSWGMIQEDGLWRIRFND